MRFATAREGYWSPEERAAYAREIAEAVRRVNRLEGETLGQVRDLLEAVRAQTIERLVWAQTKADAGGSTYDLARLGQLQQEIDRAFLELRLRFPQMAADSALSMANLAAEVADVPVRLVTGAMNRAPTELPTFGLSRSLASASAQVQASLVTRVTQETIRKISNEVSLGATGLKTPFEVMQAVGANLDDPSIFGTIARRAEVITRTELGRVQSVAGQARYEEAAAAGVAGLQKQWVHEGHAVKPRPGHVAAHGQVVGVHEPFIVEGERLMFPRDPAGSPGNTINCGCGSYPYIEGLSEGLG